MNIEMLRRMGCLVADNPIIILTLAVVFAVFSFQYAHQIEMEAGLKAFVDENSRLYQEYNDLYIERFGTDTITVLIEGGDVTSPEVLKAMEQVAQQMRDRNHVLGVRSIAEVILEAQERRTGIRSIPDDQELINKILESVDENVLGPIMIDKSHTLMAIVVPLHIDDVLIEGLVSDTKSSVKTANFPPGMKVVITGNIPLEISIKKEMSSNMTQLLLVAIALMALALFLLFRHLRLSVLPLPVVLLGIVWTFGAMGFLKIPLSFVSMAAFPVLIGLGIDYAIQFRNRIEEELAKGLSARDAAAQTVSYTAPAVLIALSLTVLGFSALLISTIPMVRDFGKLCIIGVIMCFLSAFFVGITIMIRLGSNAAQVSDSQKGRLIGRNLAKVAKFSVKYGNIVLFFTVFLAITGVYFDGRVPVETDFKEFVAQDLPELVTFRHITKLTGGTEEINVIVQGDSVGNLDTIKWIDEFGRYEADFRNEVLGATSIATVIRGMNGGNLPRNQKELDNLLKAMPQATKEQYIDGQNTALVDLSLGNAPDNIGEEGIDQLKGEIDKDVIWMEPPPGISVIQTGEAIVRSTVLLALTRGRQTMTLLGLVMIFVMLLLIYRDIIKAVLPVLPMMVVVGWLGLSMYFGGLEYTPMTATLGAMILGVGSEYAVLTMERFYEEKEKGADDMDALNLAIESIGGAVAASGMTTVFGFSALMISPFIITSNFGTVTVLAVILALFMTFSLFPVLLIGLERRRIWLTAQSEFVKKQIK